MGRDKAMLAVEGVHYARRLAEVLHRVSGLVLEVGPGRSGLDAVVEEAPGEGPLVAFACGARALAQRGWCGAILVLACDLPLMDASALSKVARHPGAGSVVPLIAGRPQPLAARWSAADVAFAQGAVTGGARSMKVLLDRPGAVFLDESVWPEGVAVRAFADVDEPGDLERLGLG